METKESLDEIRNSINSEEIEKNLRRSRQGLQMWM